MSLEFEVLRFFGGCILVKQKQHISDYMNLFCKHVEVMKEETKSHRIHGVICRHIYHTNRTDIDKYATHGSYKHVTKLKLRKQNIIRLLFSDALHLTLESVQESGNFRLLGGFLEKILAGQLSM